MFAAGAALELYEHSLMPMLVRLLDGYNVNVMALGGEHAGKTSMMEGRSGAGNEGVIGLMVCFVALYSRRCFEAMNRVL